MASSWMVMLGVLFVVVLAQTAYASNSAPRTHSLYPYSNLKYLTADVICLQAAWSYWNKYQDVRRGHDAVWHYENWGHDEGKEWNRTICALSPQPAVYIADQQCSCAAADEEYLYYNRPLLQNPDPHIDWIETIIVRGWANYHCEMCVDVPFVNGPYSLQGNCTCEAARNAYRERYEIAPTVNTVYHYQYYGGVAGKEWECGLCASNPVYVEQNPQIYNCPLAQQAYRNDYPRYNAYGEASDPFTNWRFYGSAYGFEWRSYLCANTTTTSGSVTTGNSSNLTTGPASTTGSSTGFPTPPPQCPTAAPTSQPTPQPTPSPNPAEGLVYVMGVNTLFLQNIANLDTAGYIAILSQRLGIPASDFQVAIERLASRNVRPRSPVQQLRASFIMRDSSSSLTDSILIVRSVAISNQVVNFFASQNVAFDRSEVYVNGNALSVPANSTSNSTVPFTPTLAPPIPSSNSTSNSTSDPTPTPSTPTPSTPTPSTPTPSTPTNSSTSNSAYDPTATPTSSSTPAPDHVKSLSSAVVANLGLLAACLIVVFYY